MGLSFSRGFQGDFDSAAVSSRHAYLRTFFLPDFVHPRSWSRSWWSYPRRLLSVEGIRGSGKSSFMEGLASHCPNVVLYDAPVPRFDKIFERVDDEGTRDINWNEVEQWWWAFGAKMVSAGATSVECPESTRVYVIEGSLETSLFFYAQYYHFLGHLSAARFKRLKDWYDTVKKGITVQAKSIVYLKVSPVLAFNRLKQRGLPEDAMISLDFLHVADLRMSRMFLAGSFAGTWRVVDGNCSIPNALKEYARLMPRMVVENLRHGTRAAHARVHAAFPADHESGSDTDMRSVAAHTLNDGWSDNPDFDADNEEDRFLVVSSGMQD